MSESLTWIIGSGSLWYYGANERGARAIWGPDRHKARRLERSRADLIARSTWGGFIEQWRPA